MTDLTPTDPARSPDLSPRTDASDADALFPELTLRANTQIVLLGLLAAALFLFGTTIWDALSQALGAGKRRAHEHVARIRKRRGRKPLGRAMLLA